MILDMVRLPQGFGQAGAHRSRPPEVGQGRCHNETAWGSPQAGRIAQLGALVPRRLPDWRAYGSCGSSVAASGSSSASSAGAGSAGLTAGAALAVTSWATDSAMAAATAAAS